MSVRESGTVPSPERAGGALPAQTAPCTMRKAMSISTCPALNLTRRRAIDFGHCTTCLCR